MNNQIITKVTNDKNITFNVELNKEKKKWLITFFDSRYKRGFTKLGQPISQYYLKDIIKNKNCGLDLYGAEPDWYIDYKPLQKLIKNIKKLS
jgi:hypothetical protein